MIWRTLMTRCDRRRRLNMPAPRFGCTTSRRTLDCRAPNRTPRLPRSPLVSPRKHRTKPKDAARERDAPSREEAEAAVRTLLQWIGDDPDREGLAGTPSRVVRAYEDWYSGYRDDPVEYLRRTFHEVDGYDEM